MNQLVKLFVIISFVTLESCASIIFSSKQYVTINSNPTGAIVFIDGKKTGTAPFFCQLKRKKSHTIRFELQGYNSSEILLRKKMNLWCLGNFIIGPSGAAGFGIDFATGAAFTLTPSNINVTLSPAEILTK